MKAANRLWLHGRQTPWHATTPPDPARDGDPRAGRASSNEKAGAGHANYANALCAQINAQPAASFCLVMGRDRTSLQAGVSGPFAD